MTRAIIASIAGALCLAAGTAAQTAPQWGQCGGTGWAGPTTCPDGWVCTVSSQYYSQCLQGTAPPSSVSTVSTVSSAPGGGSPTTSSAAPGTTPTLIAGYSFIRAVEDPNFHQYLRSETINTAALAVLGDPVDAAQFTITNGQLEQMVPGGTILYANIDPPTNSSEVKLGVSWKTTPDTLGSFVWGGDTVEWSSPTVTRPQNNAWLVCPDAAGNKLLFLNLGPYDYDTPAGCADETIHAYTGPYPTS